MLVSEFARDGLWWLPTGMYEENCYIVKVGDGEAAVIDPGDDADKILDLLEQKGLRAVTILLTHCHWDHIGAVPDVAEAFNAPVILHEADHALLREWAPREVQPGRFLQHGDKVPCGGIVFDVLHTPGHTPGSLCLRAGNRLFTGDTLFKGTVGRTDFPGGSAEALQASIRDNLLPLPDDVEVYPGHGDPSTIGNERRYNPFFVRLRLGQ